MKREWTMPPTTDADFLDVLDLCDPVSGGPDAWETLFSWSPGEAVTAWLMGFRAAKEGMSA